MKLRRIIYIGAAFLLILVKFSIDVIGKSIEYSGAGIPLLRELLIIAATLLAFFALESQGVRKEHSPVRTLGLLLIALVGVFIAGVALTSLPTEGFDAKQLKLIPLDYPTLFIASLLGLLFGLFAVIVLRILRDLVLHTRKKGTRRTFGIFVALALLASLMTIMLRPLEFSVFANIVFALAVLAGIVNSFRLPWIVYLTKREKLFGLVYGFLLFVGFLAWTVFISQNQTANRALLYSSYPLKEFALLMGVVGTIYFGMTFISTLFHLPTADVFERKRSEVTSLSNLSKLIAQVFDFNELAETVTSMTMRVCEATSCWLEIIRVPEEGAQGHPETVRGGAAGGGGLPYSVQVAAMKNITQDQIDRLIPTGSRSLRDSVMEDRVLVQVDDIASDPRFAVLGKPRGASGSIVIVPLVSHAGLIGILYATKESPYGFVKDDIDLISAFADQASVAIENSRLIKNSIEREHLLREMLLAQEMQKKLLPQVVPSFPTLEIDAISTPAFEVGGDYYDFMQLTPTTVGIVIGDVSGKGVSAAFYMSEMKGIFQALGRVHTSPREFMIKANDALAGSIDRRSFVSLLYGIVDVQSGILRISRAGHCPMLHVTEGKVAYVRPSGMGLGLTGGALFAEAIEEHTVHLRPGDICLLYTDGVTEARHGMDEFGYERLLGLVQQIRHKSASAIKTDIIETIQNFTGNQPNHDDLTVVVLKWHGPGGKHRSVIEQQEVGR